MKFTQKIHKNESDREFEMYTYLNAIDSPEVEKFGFAAVHYYKEWNKEYMVMALSRFEEDLIDALNKGCFNYSSKQGAVNSLILFRNFVSTSAPYILPIIHSILFFVHNKINSTELCVYIFFFIFQGTTIEIHA